MHTYTHMHIFYSKLKRDADLYLFYGGMVTGLTDHAEKAISKRAQIAVIDVNSHYLLIL